MGSALLRVIKIQVHSYRTWRGHDMRTYLKFAGYYLEFSLSRPNSSPWYCGEWLCIEFTWEPTSRTWKTNNRWFVYLYPAPLSVNGPDILNWGRPRRSVFASNPLNVWPNYQKITDGQSSPFSFEISFWCFLSQRQHKSMMVTRLNRCTAYMSKNRKGEEWIFRQRLLLWQLRKCNISAFLEH